LPTLPSSQLSTSGLNRLSDELSSITAWLSASFSVRRCYHRRGPSSPRWRGCSTTTVTTTMTMTSEVGGVLAGPSKRPAEDSRTPSISTPSRIATPPPQSDRGRLEARQNLDHPLHRTTRQTVRAGDSARSSGLDADAVEIALRREVHHRQQRESTPGGSPHRKRQRVNGDR
jgi:hypothetical protein